MTVPNKHELFEKINKLKAEKEIMQERRKKFLPLVKEANQRIEAIDKELKSLWAVYYKFYKQ